MKIKSYLYLLVNGNRFAVIQAKNSAEAHKLFPNAKLELIGYGLTGSNKILETGIKQ